MNDPDGATGATTKINVPEVSESVTGGGGKQAGAGGGGGGVGISTNVDLNVIGASVIRGGLGGTGQGSSGGGGGGVGIFSSKNVEIGTGVTVFGGTGGSAANQAGAGGGAAAILLVGGGTLTNNGSITGGTGGRVGLIPAMGGAGGNGGEGVLLTNGGTVINNAGASITGGTFGANGTAIANYGVNPSKGGSGIAGANVNVVNAGTIGGGATFGGGIVDAIKFTGGKNSLEIHSTSVINGNVQAFSAEDAFILGGSENASFDVTQIGDTAQYRGFGNFEKTGTSVWTLDSTNTDVTPWAFSGNTTVKAGTLAAGGANVLSASSAHSVSSAGTLDLAGYNQTIASLNNAGTVTLRGAGDAVGTVLTITGDYTGTDGTILLNAALGDDSSKTDRLAIQGNTSGNTNLRVNNISSTGGVTVEGIKLIDVGGNSDGTFALQGDYIFEGSQAVVSGAYAYRLYKNGVTNTTDGDWYLRSTLKDKAPVDPTTPGTPLYNPAVPVFEAYAGALLNLNSVSTLQQRVGDRYLKNAAPAQGSSPAIWGRIEAAHSKFQPKTSTSSTDYDLDTVKMEAGLDGQFYENANGKLIGGFSAHYTDASADASSIFGSGKIDIKGYGIGSTLTWYGETGFYVDGQAQATWYNSDLFSNDTKRGLANSNDAFGYVLSVETGKRFALNPSWMLTPQAQLVYSSVDFDSFDTAYTSGSSYTSLGKADSLKARLGIAAEHQNAWLDAEGKTTRTNIYGIANLYQEFLNGTNVNVSGANFAIKNDQTWGGIGTGGSYNWGNDKYSLYGEVSYNTSLSNFADSYSVNGKAGFKVAF